MISFSIIDLLMLNLRITYQSAYRGTEGSKLSYSRYKAIGDRKRKVDHYVTLKNCQQESNIGQQHSMYVYMLLRKYF